MSKLFETVKVGRYTLANRLAMGPMTRSRAQYDGTPGELAAEYYAQRADVGLIVTEGTQPSEDGQGYMATPGIHTDAHVAGCGACKRQSPVHSVDACGPHVPSGQYAAPPAGRGAFGHCAEYADVHARWHAGHPGAACAQHH